MGPHYTRLVDSYMCAKASVCVSDQSSTQFVPLRFAMQLRAFCNNPAHRGKFLNQGNTSRSILELINTSPGCRTPDVRGGASSGTEVTVAIRK